MKSLVFTAAVVCSALCLPISSPILAATRYADVSVSASGDGTSWETAFKTIQEGIDTSSDGDTVIVAEGTYVENVKFNGKNIVLTSTDPLDPDIIAKTIIDGNQAGSVVTFSGTEDETCVLSGFTIRNGLNAVGGGGIHGAGTLAVIANNTIVSNEGSGGGGVYRCHGLIEGNLIAYNAASGGGGLWGCNGLVRGNRIEHNSASSGGGLIWCEGTVSDNLILHNSAAYGGGLSRCHGIVERCIIAGSTAAMAGGGMSICHGTIQNCIISANSAHTGGAMYSCGGLIQNNTILGNVAEFGGGLNTCGGTVLNCIIWLNTAPDGPQVRSTIPRYSCIQGWQLGGIGNFAEDPLFVHIEGPDGVVATWEDNDLRLSPSSSCIDAGANYYWTGWPVRDLDGNCRLVNGRVDIGCYEFGSSPDSDGDLLADIGEPAHGTDPDNPDTDGDGLPDSIEVMRGTDPTRPNQPSSLVVPSDVPSIQQAIQVALDGEEIIVMPCVYLENIHFLGKNITLRTLDPTDRQTTETTTIDGSLSGSVVSFAGTEGDNCIISGFTIRNGRAFCGGGIYGGDSTMHSRARIQHNVILNNTARSAGGGIYACDGLIWLNTVSQNAAANGGGLSQCNGPIKSNTITANLADYHGGGLEGSSGQVVNNLVAGNTVLEGGGGGLSGVEGLVYGNLVLGNHATWGGGLSGCYEEIVNNTVVANSADSKGGGISGSVGSLSNLIIWGNTCAQGPQLSDSSSPTYSCIQDWTGGGDGNIAEDPGFMSAENGDFRLLPDSPCIDAGFNSPDLPEFDIAGMHRVMFGGKSLTADMGAYEFYINKLEPVPGTNEAVFTWSSLADKTYSIFYTDDLFNWHTAIANFPSSGNQTTSWTDDGFLTGIPPLLAPKRFYRILENP